MRARDILDTTHQLEEQGMNRPQAEIIATTVAAAIEPLATKEELAAAVEPLATKKDMDALEERLGAKIESTKVWLLGGLLVIALSIAAASLQFAASMAGERGVETGESIRRQPDSTTGPIPVLTDLSSTNLLYNERRWRQVVQKLGHGIDAGYQQAVSRPRAGDVKQMAFGVVDFFEVGVVGDVFDSVL